MTSPYNQSVAIKAAIIAVLNAARSSGGPLASVASVGTTSYPESNLYPYIGLGLIHREEVIRGSGPTRESTLHWGLNISVRTTTLLSDAVAARDLLVDDGNGKGVEPLLRTMYTSELGGLIGTCEIKSVTLLDNADGSAQTQFFADALIMFDTTQFIKG